MKNIVKNIAVLLIVGSFIISATGIYLTIHYCSSDNFTTLFFFSPLEDEPCDHHRHDPEKCEESADSNSKPGNIPCCNIPASNTCQCPETGQMAACCSNTIIYIVVEDYFVRSDQPDIQVTYNLLKPVYETDLLLSSVSAQKEFPFVQKKSPPGLHGKDLIYFKRTLLL